MFKKTILFLCSTVFLFGCKTVQNKTLLFIGSFTDKKPGEGIHVYEFNTETGEANLTFTLDNITNTSFLKISKDGNYLYSVVDSQMKHNGKVAAFKVDAINSKIELLNMQDCGGLNPAHLAIDNSGSYLVNSNYSDGTLSLFKIKEDGGLTKTTQLLQFKDSSVIKSRQKSSHMHSANFSPDDKYVFGHDLGADKIRGFQLENNQGKVSLKNPKVINVKPGSGPRHFVFHPNGKFGYLVNELSGKVDAYNYNNGSLDFIEDYATYQQKQDIYRTADIHISPDGQFLYASNRGQEENTIVVFSINKNNGKLQLIEHVDTAGNHPRNFAISDDGNFLLVANQFTNNITIFKRNIKTGSLTKLPNQITVNSPSSIQLKSY
ncbi:lactonase family protein [Polaribacter sp. KT 15]|uniref:lactonase family protein n=1 Tax=Polaribacter sp. KT 15 TaxID=1896175 RepID=UPI00090BCF0D|nr:lactonase family protein [Polaribacter sp. KT 15]SHM88635.1 6-phosphogluconolactonase, cycloisomerase 2 family [Polaribacter sp. KT 15]